MADLDPGENTNRETSEELAAGAARAGAYGVPGAAGGAGTAGTAAGAVAGQMAADNLMDNETGRERDAEVENERDIPGYIAGTPASIDSPGSPDSFAGEGNTPDAQRDLYDDKHGIEEG